MKSKTSLWGIVGWVIIESIWIIDLAVDLYTGEVTYKDFILMLVFCAFSAVVIVSVIKKMKRKNRERNK